MLRPLVWSASSLLLAAWIAVPAAPSAAPATPGLRLVSSQAGALLEVAETDTEADVRATRALDSIKAEHLRADLFFLASDELAGRDSPSFEQRLAARFIRARLQRLGLEPGAGDSYLHTYQLPWRALELAHCHAALERQIGGQTMRLGLHPGADYFYPGERGARDQTTSGELVWIGAGTKEELKSVELEGLWALSPLTRDQLESPAGRQKLETSLNSRGNTARLKDAAGLLLLCAADVPRELLEQRLRPILERLVQGRVGAPGQPESEGRGREFPTLVLTASAAAEMCAFVGLDLGAPPAVGARLGATFTETRAQAKNAQGEHLVELENVAGFWPGSDPKLKSEVIIVSAHYDHVGRFGEEVWNGADDNGSGTVGMLSVAEALTVYGPLKRSVLFLWVSAEEKGLFGSQAWCQAPILPEGAKVVANLNMDMIGRNAPDDLMMTPTQALGEIYNGLARIAEKHGPSEGFPEFRSADDYYGRSDQISFQKAFNVPVIFLFADVHEDYHQPTDEPDRIDYDKVRRVSRLITRMLLDLQAKELNL
jgi:Peptidase family M28